MLIVAVTILAAGLGLGAFAVLAGKPEASGVDRSLALIDGTTAAATRLSNERSSKERLAEPVLDRLKKMAMLISPGDTTLRLTRMLDKAGNPPAWTVDRLMGVKGAALVGGLLLGLVYGGLSFFGVLIAIAVGVVLFWVPDLLLYNAGAKRREQARKGLAEALDMLTVCVEAGQGFDAALGRVAKNITGPISGEFARALSEVQIGRSRGEAFAGLGQRLDVPEVRNFVTSLVQADRLGLPIAAVLREQTKAMREARRMRAEEKAQAVTVKILFPLMLCVLPAVFIVIIGPGAIRMVDAFSNM